MFGKKKESADPVPAAVAAAPAPVAQSAGISPEIIAVIAAAIAAMTGSEAGSNGLFIRKISRIHGEKVTWSNAGLMECIDSRKF
jgi:glutaconyl-CoA/methylmalonyl-CoA decarboxylase subunit delta